MGVATAAPAEMMAAAGIRLPAQAVVPPAYVLERVMHHMAAGTNQSGWKIAYCLAPAQLTAEFRKVHQFNVFTVHHPAQLALADPREGRCGDSRLGLHAGRPDPLLLRQERGDAGGAGEKLWAV
jgi:hypothetical protein